MTSGTTSTTASGAVGTSGSPTRIYAIHFVSGGGGNGVVTLRNGTSASDTPFVIETGTTSLGKTVEFGTHGVFFPAGCYAEIDANVARLTINFSK